MSAVGHRKALAGQLGRKAAEAYLQSECESGDATISGVAERFGIARATVWNALVRLRAERRRGPEALVRAVRR